MSPEALLRAQEAIRSNTPSQWRSELPALLVSLSATWSLELGEPFEDLSYHFVCRARRADEDVVLKVGPPNPERRYEIAALSDFDPAFSVRLLEVDASTEACLLELLTPGTTMQQVWSLDRDEQLTIEAAQLIRDLPKPLPVENEYPSVRDWAKVFARIESGGLLTREMVNLARALMEGLLDSAEQPHLLHGDLHHGNIVRDGGRWKAIDPHGVWGERLYETGSFLRNPVNVPYGVDLWPMLKRRIEVFAEVLGASPQRILEYAYAQAVISVLWTVEDGGVVDEAEIRWVSALRECL